MELDNRVHRHRTHLFVMRIWHDELSGGRCEWRGRVEHTISGKGQYFRDWDTLTAFLLEALPVLETDPLAHGSAIPLGDEAGEQGQTE
jgi:hypothetical protein